MDALFEPIASATGGSIDQIKARLSLTPPYICLMRCFSVNRLLAIFLSSRQPIHPHTNVAPRTQAYIQHCYHILLPDPGVGAMGRSNAAPRECYCHILYCAKEPY